MPIRSKLLNKLQSVNTKTPGNGKAVITAKSKLLLPYWQTADNATVRFYQGHVIDVLKRLPAQSVHCVVTSPPYWGLRDYGTGQWEGGNPECDHLQAIEKRKAASGTSTLGYPSDGGQRRITDDNQYFTGSKQQQYKDQCKKCGARRVDMQIGSEPSPDCLTRGQAQCGRCFVCSLVAVFREVRRVLRDDGTCWINLGDTYGTGKCGGGTVFSNGRTDGKPNSSSEKYPEGKGDVIPSRASMKTRTSEVTVPSGNLLGMPWRVALALQADGWTLRQDIIFAKKSPMPESVQNRCTKSHEFVFLLTKGMKYFYDAEAIKEKSVDPVGSQKRYESNFGGAKNEALVEANKDGIGRRTSVIGDREFDGSRNKRDVWSLPEERALLDWLSVNHPDTLTQYLNESRNKGDVWRIASQGYPGCHYATFSSSLITPMILAGTSEKGCCAKCGKPWKRVTEEKKLTRERPNEYVKRTGEKGTGNSCANTVAGVEVKTVGWNPDCDCYNSEDGKCRKCGADWSVQTSKGASYKPVVVAPGIRNVDDSRQDKTRKISGPEYNAQMTKIKTIDRGYPCQCFVNEVVPCTILDPFIGSGTTAAVCLEKGRRCIGIDLSEEYLKVNAIPRIEGILLSRPATVKLLPGVEEEDGDSKWDKLYESCEIEEEDMTES